MKPLPPVHLWLLLLLCYFGAFSARANIYATDIRLNGSLNVGIFIPSNSVTINYILNDTATAGVTVQIMSGTNVIKTYSSTNGMAGTNAGLNSVVWDGSTDSGTNLADGAYTVSITAASAGYDDWTNISNDGSGFTVLVPRGIAVNQNTNSPYFGRVFVANAIQPFGIYKYNADGSPADEGGFSNGGLDWGQATHYSPWKMAISADDRVYVDDFSANGVIYAFDQLISPESAQVAIGTQNYPTNDPTPQLSGLAVTGSGTNTEIWVADGATNGSAGIVVWQASEDGLADTNDTGTVVAPVDTNSSLSVAPWDIALNTNVALFASQCVTNDNNVNPLMQFPPFAGSAETNASWAVGSGDPTLAGISGIAVDPTSSYLAVAVVGTNDAPESGDSGFLDLYNAGTGQFETNLDEANFATVGGHSYYDAAWDLVGNLYALDGTALVWRIYSPPGSNQFTTVAAPFIQVYNTLIPPVLANPVICCTNLRFTLLGQSNISYAILQSPDLINWTPIETNFSSHPERDVIVPQQGDNLFYKAMTLP